MNHDEYLVAIKSYINQKVNAENLEKRLFDILDFSENDSKKVVEEYLLDLKSKTEGTNFSELALYQTELINQKSFFQTKIGLNSQNVLNYLNKIITKQGLINTTYFCIYTSTSLFSLEYNKRFKDLIDAYTELRNSFIKIQILYLLISTILNDTTFELASISNIDKYRDEARLFLKLFEKTKDLQEQISTYKSELSERNNKINELKDENFDLRGLKTENKVLKNALENRLFQFDDFFEDYLFGDHIDLYSKIFGLLKEYDVFLENGSFAYFIHTLQKQPKFENKISLKTNEFFTLNLLGYLFFKLKEFSIKNKSIDKTFDFLNWFDSHFIIKKRNGVFTKLTKRYLSDIKPKFEQKITPNQIDVKDKIDNFFDR